jgi:hypothetical protein
MKKIVIIIAVLLLPIAAMSINPIATTYGQTDGNATNLQSAIESAKSKAPQGSLIQGAQPGDVVITLICPQNATGFEQCQWFVGVPVQ